MRQISDIIAENDMQGITFSTNFGFPKIRCSQGALCRWRLSQIQPLSADNGPILLEINDNIYRIVSPNQSEDIPEMYFNKDAIYRMILIPCTFSFKGISQGLQNNLPKPYNIRIHPTGHWTLYKDKELFLSKSFYLLRMSNTSMFGSIPLESKIREEFELFIFDVEQNRVELERIA